MVRGLLALAVAVFFLSSAGAPVSVAAPGATVATAGGSGTIALVSAAIDGTAGNGPSCGSGALDTLPQACTDISGNGRFVAFASKASNLAPGDLNGDYDVFVRDRDTDADGIFDEAGEVSTKVVSVDSAGNQGNLPSGPPPSLSSDGRSVAFVSIASDLVPGDTNGGSDTFVHDLETGATVRVSVNTAGQQSAGGGRLFNDISGNGRFVAFDSEAPDLVPQDTNAVNDVFVRDRDTDADGIFDEPVSVITILAGVDSNGSQAEHGSGLPAISADGRFVTFMSLSALVPEDTNSCLQYPGYSCPDVFVHDLVTGATIRVSVSSSGEQGNGLSCFFAKFNDLTCADISANGRFIAFKSRASNLVAGDTNGAEDVFVRDRDTDDDGIFDEAGAVSTTRVSVSTSGEEGNGWSEHPSITADGRYVAFHSWASNLVPGDTNGTGDVFIHDRLTGRTVRASTSASGVEGDGLSAAPSINADGRQVSFWSLATNLVPDDTNNFCDYAQDGAPYENCADVFVRDLGDADGDGEWDPFDNCPTVANADGQLADADGDLAGDACDGSGSGNVDCSGPTNGVSAVDALKVLRHVAGLSVSQNEPCLDIGQPRQLAPPDDVRVGDVDCSGVANAVDALKILRSVAGLSVAKPLECPEVRPP